MHSFILRKYTSLVNLQRSIKNKTGPQCFRNLFSCSTTQQQFLEKVEFHFSVTYSCSARLAKYKSVTLLTFWFKLLVQKSLLHGAVYTKSVRESLQTSYVSSQSSTSSLRKIQIFKFAYSALLLFYSLFRFKIITAWCCIYEKR